MPKQLQLSIFTFSDSDYEAIALEPSSPFSDSNGARFSSHVPRILLTHPSISFSYYFNNMKMKHHPPCSLQNESSISCSNSSSLYSCSNSSLLSSLSESSSLLAKCSSLVSNVSSRSISSLMHHAFKHCSS